MTRDANHRRQRAPRRLSDLPDCNSVRPPTQFRLEIAAAACPSVPCKRGTGRCGGWVGGRRLAASAETATRRARQQQQVRSQRVRVVDWGCGPDFGTARQHKGVASRRREGGERAVRRRPWRSRLRTPRKAKTAKLATRSRSRATPHFRRACPPRRRRSPPPRGCGRGKRGGKRGKRLGKAAAREITLERQRATTKAPAKLTRWCRCRRL